MSQENIEASRRLWDRFLADDMAGVLECMDADVEVHDMPELPGASVYHGHVGWRQQIEKFREAFGQIDYRVLEHVDCGGGVVTVVEATATGTGSGVTGTVPYAQLEVWHEGKVTAIRYFPTKEAALEAAGLPE